ncbi:tumor necrosis factor receptor superfamily member 17 isoform X1 [Puntigrus tetrazona]|uniref:tumor necrosis factor receptor superfamily member 17 isoform X1 n=1 Tax=Puntigrus tetrazona TaxID=1606681 RepID=UPI001C8AB7A3|nr:tumor necrosis factor receptor superfamily member 17 isoform X1 [Puntigrus tetrazona]
MLLFLLLLYVIIYAEGKCAKNYYYDGLLEECQHCSIRCNSPPITCKKFCTSIPENEVEKNQNIRLILIVFFVFLGAFTVLTIILQVIRRKSCKPIMNKVIGQEHKNDSERGSNATEQSEDTDEATTYLPEGLNQDHYNSNLPLPSTEEGTTLLVTTKTVQAYHCTPVI